MTTISGRADAGVNILLFGDVDRIEAQRIRIHDHRLENLLNIQGSQPGDTLKVGEIDGQLGTGRVLSIGREAAELAINLHTPPPPKLPLVLLVALPRPKMLRRVLRAAAEFGVPELHLLNSYRVEKSFWQSPVLNEQTRREYMLQGLEQSIDTVLPQVHLQQRFKPFVEDTLPAMLSDRRALVAHPGDYEEAPRGMGDEPTLLAIGPEGGFTEYEVGKLVQAGCSPVSLGPRILRVENAVTALLGRLF